MTTTAGATDVATLGASVVDGETVVVGATVVDGVTVIACGVAAANGEKLDVTPHTWPST